MKPTVYITLVLVALVAIAVVDGEDAEQPDSSKKIVVFM